MNYIQTIINGVDKMQSVVHVVKAVLAGVETFTNELKKSTENSEK
jgi:hypothetical protein